MEQLPIMRNNAVLIRDCFRVDDGWSRAGVGLVPPPRLGSPLQRPPLFSLAAGGLSAILSLAEVSREM
jgi:hypothetical protein